MGVGGGAVIFYFSKFPLIISFKAASEVVPS